MLTWFIDQNKCFFRMALPKRTGCWPCHSKKSSIPWTTNITLLTSPSKMAWVSFLLSAHCSACRAARASASNDKITKLYLELFGLVNDKIWVRISNNLYLDTNSKIQEMKTNFNLDIYIYIFSTSSTKLLMVYLATNTNLV